MLETITKAEENCRNEVNEEYYNGNYVDWRGKKVKIPGEEYNAGGRPERYTPEKVLSTLNFYYRMILNSKKSKFGKNKFKEVLDEEQEEKHHKSLLDAVIAVAVDEKVCTMGYLHPLQANRGLHGKNMRISKILKTPFSYKFHSHEQTLCL